MKYRNSIRFKAVFLLLVFSLNTVVGFACAMGWNINLAISHDKDELLKPSSHTHTDGKKHHHQQESEKAPVHIHANGKKHHHQNEPANALTHVHPDGKKHQHKGEVSKLENVENETPKKEKDDCCTDEVLKFQNLDKSLIQNAKTTIDAPVFITTLSNFLSIELFKISTTYPPIYKARFFYPPPPDIRIAIQSFQI